MTTKLEAPVVRHLSEVMDRTNVDTPWMNDCSDAIHETVLAAATGPGAVIQIEGDPQVGKTRVVKILADLVRSDFIRPLQGRTLYCGLEAASDARDLDHILARLLGRASIPKRNASRAGDVLHDILRDGSVSSIVLDHAHLLDRAKADEIDFAAGLLARIAMRGGISLLLVGREAPTAVTRILGHVLPIAPEKLALPSFPFQTTEDVGRFAGFIEVFCGDIIAEFDTAGIGIDNLWTDNETRRLLMATGGNVGFFVRLLKRALAVLAGAKDPVLNRRILAEALRKEMPRPFNFNPFVRDEPPGIKEIITAWSHSEAGKKRQVGTNDDLFSYQRN